MLRVRLAVAAGLVVVAVVVTAVLLQSPRVVLAANSVAPSTVRTFVHYNALTCQAGERLPRATTAIRLSLGQFTGSAVMVEALAGTRVVTSGARGSGWGGQTVTVPVRSVAHTISPVTICSRFLKSGGERVTIFGNDGRIHIEYLGAARSSWLTLLPSVASNMARGRAWSGRWIALLVSLLMLASIAIASALIVRGSGA